MVGLSWLPQKQPRQRNARAAPDEGAVSKPSWKPGGIVGHSDTQVDTVSWGLVSKDISG